MKSDDYLRDNNILFTLDEYDDIFSDFDSADYAVRSLSGDFMNECRKASLDKKNVFNLIFLANKIKRDKTDELHIIKRLEHHFDKHYREKKKELYNIKKTGILWFIFGGLIMSLAMVFHYQEGFIFDVLVIFSEPAGWFMFWEGLAKIFIEAKKEMHDFEFYKKMSVAKIMFSTKLGYKTNHHIQNRSKHRKKKKN
jgi:hypothetical protein